MSIVQVKERPILFSTPMVQAILEGRKTQTRRIVKTPKKLIEFYQNGAGQWANSKTGEMHEIACGATFNDGFGRFLVAGDMGYENIPCPYGKVNDRLWVKETWRPRGDAPLSQCVDKNDVMFAASLDEFDRGIFKWKSSIFMPRWASRIALEITDIRVERVQGISEQDAISEGVEQTEHGWKCYGDCPEHKTGHIHRSSATASFMSLWDSINGKKQPWDSNPYVWVISFKKQESTNEAN